MKLANAKNFADVKRRLTNAFSEKGAEAASALRDLIDELEASEVEYDVNEFKAAVEELIAKTEAYAEKWAPVAEEIWNEKEHSQPSYENYTKEKREHPELAGFDHPDGTHSIDLN